MSSTKIWLEAEAIYRDVCDACAWTDPKEFAQLSRDDQEAWMKVARGVFRRHEREPIGGPTDPDPPGK